MSVQLRRNADLFYKALEDVWVAEQIWQGSPNNAVWHCAQAVEKTMKGFLRCINKDFGYDHQLRTLLDEVGKSINLTENITTYILYLNRFEVGLRYKNLSSDPTKEDAKTAISRAKEIMREFSNDHSISSYMDEAKAVHSKILESLELKLLSNGGL
jgi:HEPN domain-containing protein